MGGANEDNWTDYSPDGCVPTYWICDGWEDCLTGNDEESCGEDEESCSANEGIFCGDDEENWTSYSPFGCVPSYWICDQRDDCVDGSDEVECEIIDDENTCIADGGIFCGDDEENWTNYSPFGCVPSYWVCDEWEDCVDGRDEIDCEV